MQAALRFPVTVDPAPENELAIPVDFSIPSGDIPYFVKTVYSESRDRIQLLFKYNGEDKEVCESNVEFGVVHYGGLTGRIYRMVVDGLKQFGEPRSLRSKIEEIKNPEKRSRFNANIEFGALLVEMAVAKFQEMNTERTFDFD